MVESFANNQEWEKKVMALISIDREIRPELEEKKYSWIMANEIFIASELEAGKLDFFRDWTDLKPDQYLRNAARFRNRRVSWFYFHSASGEVLPSPENL